jgi:hypothetical protein
MNDSSIGSQRQIPIWIDVVRLSELFISLLDVRFVQNDSRCISQFSMDINIVVHLPWPTGLPVLNDIVIPG